MITNGVILTIFQEGLTFGEILRVTGIVLVVLIPTCLVGAIIVFIIAIRQVRDIDVPPDADFFETLQLVPITVPIALDLLDGAFDIFAAPIAWFILELMGLQALQMVTVVEGLIPGTQLIPTMTASWVVARIMNKRSSNARSAMHDYQLRSSEQRYAGLRTGEAGMTAERYRQKALGPGGSSQSGLGSDPLNDNVVDAEYTEYDEYDPDYDEPPPEYFEDFN